MDYEKKYEDALKRCRKLYNEAKANEYTSDMEDYEFIFPELAESEDERIRKALVRFHKSTIDIDGIKGADILAWLEKQGERKQEWSEEDKNFMYDTLSNLTELKDRYGDGYGNVGKCIEWLKSLKYRVQGKEDKQ